MAYRLVNGKFVNTNDPQFQMYNALGRDAASGSDNFFAKRGASLENAFGTTGAALVSAVDSRRQNAKTDQMLADNQTKLDDIARKYGYGSYKEAMSAVEAADTAGDANRMAEFENGMLGELKAQSATNVDVANKNARDWQDYRQNSYVGQKINQDRGKFLGSAINTLSTGADVLLPGAGVAFNAVQGGVEGVADELEQNGLQNFDWGRAGQNAAIGAIAGGVVGGVNRGISNRFAKNGGNLFKGSNALTSGLNKLGSSTALGRVGSTLATGAARGAVSGAVGGATGAGLSSAINGVDFGQGVANALQGAAQGARQGAIAGGVMSGANMALNNTPGVGNVMRQINQAGEDWGNSGDTFAERARNTWNSGNSPIANRITDYVSKTGRFGNEYTAFQDNPEGAIGYLNNRQQGVAKNAIPTAEDGSVDLPYGRKDYFYNERRRQPGGGIGLEHIENDDGRTIQDAYNMVDTLGNGRRVESGNPTRIAYENQDGTRRAVISTDFEGKEVDPYVLSAYTKKAPSAESTLNLDTDGANATITQSDQNVNTYEHVNPTTRKVTTYSEDEVRNLAANAKIGKDKKVWADGTSNESMTALDNDEAYMLAEIYAKNSPELKYMNLNDALSEVRRAGTSANKQFKQWVKDMGDNTPKVEGDARAAMKLPAQGDSQLEAYMNSNNKINEYLAVENEGIPQGAPAYARVEAAYDDAVKTLRDTYTDAQLADMLRGGAKPKVKSLVEAAMKLPANEDRVFSANGRDEQYTFASDDNTPQAIKQAAVDYSYETDGRIDPSELTDFYNQAKNSDIDINALASRYAGETSGRVDPNELVEFFLQTNAKGSNNATPTDTPETEVYRALTGETEQPFLAYGESELGNRTRRGMVADSLERLGNTFEGAQTNVTRAAAKDLGIESTGKVVENVRKKTGITNLETQARIAKELTGGENSLMDNIQRQALTASDNGKGYEVDTTPILSEIDSIVDKYADTNMFGSMNARNKFISNIKRDISNYDSDVLSIANRMKANAADLRGKGVASPSAADSAKAKIYSEVASRLDDLSYKAIPQENVDAMFEATINEMRGRAKQAAQNGNKDIEKAYNTLATDLEAQPRTIKAFRSFKKDFVDVSKIADLTAQAENGAAAQMGRSFGGGLKRFFGTVAQRPVNAALAKAGGAINRVADRVAGEGTPTQATSTVENAKYNPVTQIYNAIGRTEGLTNGEQARTTNYISNAVQNANTLEDLVAPSNKASTSAYNAVYGNPTSTDGNYWSSVIESAMRAAMAAGDATAFGQLYTMYQDALAKQKEDNTETKLTDKQRQANAAARALEDMEDTENNFGYDISDVPVLGGIVNMTGNDYKAKAEALALQVGYMLSGATVNAQEAKNIGMAYVPQPRESETERKRKLAQLRKIISDYQKTYVE